MSEDQIQPNSAALQALAYRALGKDAVAAVSAGTTLSRAPDLWYATIQIAAATRDVATARLVEVLRVVAREPRGRPVSPAQPDMKLPTESGFYWARCTAAFREEHGADAFEGDAVVEYTGGPDHDGCVEIPGCDLLFAVEDFEWLEGPIRRTT